MSGGPMKALKVGALEIGKVILGAETKPFEHFYTFAYDNVIEINCSNDIQSYEQFIGGINGRSNTDFAIVFD